MSADLTWLRIHFERMMEEWWETIKTAYELQPVILDYWTIKMALTPFERTGVQIELLDHQYRTYRRQDLDVAIISDWTNRRMATGEWNDCDDFAWRFKGHLNEWFRCNAVAFVLDKSSWHAYNIIISAEGAAQLFEPQQDRWVELGDPITVAVPAGGVGTYSLTEGIILI